jgi:hypothetical protein
VGGQFLAEAGAARLTSARFPIRMRASFCAELSPSRPTVPKRLFNTILQFGHDRFQVTFNEHPAAPPHTSAVRVGNQDLKAERLQII